jgi:predicted AAA+ superfamily ATPase
MSNIFMFKRPMLAELATFCREQPSVIQALIGPRQVGKTTLARQLMAQLPFPSVYASSDAPLPPARCRRA